MDTRARSIRVNHYIVKCYTLPFCIRVAPMFWVYLAVVIVPSVCFYAYINRDNDGADAAFMWSFAVLVVQSLLVIIGGWVCISLAALLCAFGLFLGYGAWYMPRLERLIDMPVGQHIVFNYSDRIGRQSRRRVLITSSDNTYINGICETRNSARTFRRSRILGGIIIESTGEVIDPNAPAFPLLHKK